MNKSPLLPRKSDPRTYLVHIIRGEEDYGYQEVIAGDQQRACREGLKTLSGLQCLNEIYNAHWRVVGCELKDLGRGYGPVPLRA